MKPTIGRIVHYRLSPSDCARYALKQEGSPLPPSPLDVIGPGGKQHYVGGASGNDARIGDIVPLLIVRVWENEYKEDSKIGHFDVALPPGAVYKAEACVWSTPKSTYGINGQAFMDGETTLWVTSAPQGDWPGSWDWPEIV